MVLENRLSVSKESRAHLRLDDWWLVRNLFLLLGAMGLGFCSASSSAALEPSIDTNMMFCSSGSRLELLSDVLDFLRCGLITTRSSRAGSLGILVVSESLLGVDSV